MSFKAFVSEAEINEIRKKKQDEWDKKRAAAGEAAANMPIERPEDPVEHKSLAERLEENRIKKQEEYDEAHKWKNMIYGGMDDDEYEHIEKLEAAEREKQRQRVRDEAEAYREFQRKQKQLPSQTNDKTISETHGEPKVKIMVTTKNSKAKPSALSALKASIKLKPKTTEKRAEQKRSQDSLESNVSNASSSSKKAKIMDSSTSVGGLGLVGYGSDDDDSD